MVLSPLNEVDRERVASTSQKRLYDVVYHWIKQLEGMLVQVIIPYQALVSGCYNGSQGLFFIFRKVLGWWLLIIWWSHISLHSSKTWTKDHFSIMFMYYFHPNLAISIILLTRVEKNGQKTTFQAPKSKEEFWGGTIWLLKPSKKHFVDYHPLQSMLSWNHMTT